MRHDALRTTAAVRSNQAEAHETSLRAVQPRRSDPRAGPRLTDYVQCVDDRAASTVQDDREIVTGMSEAVENRPEQSWIELREHASGGGHRAHDPGPAADGGWRREQRKRRTDWPVSCPPVKTPDLLPSCETGGTMFDTPRTEE